eukprot:SM000081S22689  [mRNA]  locus=s81:572079:574269:- [translate_table: standard]
MPFSWCPRRRQLLCERRPSSAARRVSASTSTGSAIDEAAGGVTVKEDVANGAAAEAAQEQARKDEELQLVQDLLKYLNTSWTPFHATAETRKRLLASGFQQLKEEDEWDLEAGGRYFFTRNMSSIIAFAIGNKCQAGSGFNIIAAHTDSPCPKLKPVSLLTKSGYLSVGVQTYGGGLWHTWFDRDLSVAGRVLLRSQGGELRHELVKVMQPIIRIPTLAIHLDRTVITDGFKINLETQFAPVLATQIKTELSASVNPAEAGAKSQSPPKGEHHSLLLEVLAQELSCSPGDIADFELNVCDTQPSCTGGGRGEFIFSGRLDNLASSFCALRALVDTSSQAAELANETCTRMVALFDNEEVGSESAQGAGSPLMMQAMKRISHCLSR